MRYYKYARVTICIKLLFREKVTLAVLFINTCLIAERKTVHLHTFRKTGEFCTILFNAFYMPGRQIMTIVCNS